MSDLLLHTIKERGLLLEKDVFEFLRSFQDESIARTFLMDFERVTGQKIITTSTLHKNLEYVQRIVGQLPGGDRTSVENVCIKLGIHLEIHKEQSVVPAPHSTVVHEAPVSPPSYRVLLANTGTSKKLDIQDFIGNFRSRYQQLQRILMQRPDLNTLVAINKISSNRQNLSLIGMLREKRVTKNKNLILSFEDLTGEIQVLVRADREELYTLARELQLDDVVAIKASGNREMLFAHEIFFPEAFIAEKMRFQEDINIAFISDLHCGSDRHLGQSLSRFLDWLEQGEGAAKTIKYLFISGDTVDGVGVFPGQEHVLKLKSMKEQYVLLASYLRRVPKHITMFLCPGQHDAVRVAEPQPIIGAHYAAPLHEIENLVLVTNPTLVKLLEGDKEFKVLMYHGASIHGFINEIPALRLMKAHRTPAKAVKYMLQRRHLAPTHSAVVYIPNVDRDPLVIGEVPDVLCTGEVHRLDVETHHGVLIITGSCWQAQTPFEEKVGNVPDPAKVPVLNLKTRELKIFDFGVEEEIIREY